MLDAKERWGIKAVVCLLATIATMLLLAAPAFAVDLNRYAGAEAVDTAIESSKAAFADNSCKTVLLARDDDFMDSMSATGLAGAYNAPILLTNRETLSSQTLQEIQRLGAKKVIIVGGPKAVYPEVATALKSAGLTVSRVYGEAAYDTSVKCAKEIVKITKDTSKVIVTSSYTFLDSLSLSSFAYKYKVPILIQTFGDLSSDRFCSDDELALLKDTFADATIYIAGGTGAVSEESVEGALGRDAVRMWGQTGYDTSNEVARYMTENGFLDEEVVGIANGQTECKGLDALTASALCAKNNAPILLTENNSNSVTINGYLAEEAGTINNTLIFGGNLVIGDDVMVTISKIVNMQLRTVAIIGADRWHNKSGSFHLEGSDLQMVMRIDSINRTISLVSIPRDTYYDNTKGGTVDPGKSCSCDHCLKKYTWQKSNYAFHYGFYEVWDKTNYDEAIRNGAEACKTMMSEVLGVGINDYAVVDLNTYQSIVDQFGGISVDVPLPITNYTFYSGEDPVSINYGPQVLDGYHSMVAARARTPYELGKLQYDPAYSTAWSWLVEGVENFQDPARQALNRRQFTSLMRSGLAAGSSSILDFMIDQDWIKTTMSEKQIAVLYDAVRDYQSEFTVHCGSTRALSGSVQVVNGVEQYLIPYDQSAWSDISYQFQTGQTLSSGYGYEDASL